MSKPPRLGRQIREYEVDSIIVPDTACIDKNVSAWTSVDVAILKLKPLPILRPTSLSFYDESTYDSIYDGKYVLCQTSAIPKFGARMIKKMFSPVFCGLNRDGLIPQYYQCHASFETNLGDSGGPVFAMQDSRMKLIGINSFIKGLVAYSVPLFTFTHWLHNVLEKPIKFSLSDTNKNKIDSVITIYGPRFRGFGGFGGFGNEANAFIEKDASIRCTSSMSVLDGLRCNTVKYEQDSFSLSPLSLDPLSPEQVLQKSVFGGLINGWEFLRPCEDGKTTSVFGNIIFWCLRIEDAHKHSKNEHRIPHLVPVDIYSFCDIPKLTKDTIHRVCFSNAISDETVYFQQLNIVSGDTRQTEPGYFVNPTPILGAITGYLHGNTWSNTNLLPTQRENLRIQIRRPEGGFIAESSLFACLIDDHFETEKKVCSGSDC